MNATLTTAAPATSGQRVPHRAVTGVVCVALAAVVAAMSSLNVALPDIARSTHADPDPADLDHRRLLAGLRRAAAARQARSATGSAAAAPCSIGLGDLRRRLGGRHDGRPARTS